MGLNVSVADGKYTVHLDYVTGKLTASRYGEPWRDLCGDNLVYRLAVELADARKLFANARHELNKEKR